MSALHPVVVVGAGISGLVCAYALRRVGIDALLLESSNRPGGLIRSERREGFLLEFGPQSFSGTPALRELCRELGIESEQLQADPRAPRYVLVNGRLTPVPLSPSALFASSLLSWRTKWSILQDAFGHTVPPQEDESTAQFIRRKFSKELLDRLAGPFVSGIYAGDPERLSLRATFPQLYEAEKSKGSVTRGVMAAAKAKPGPRERPSLLSFREGTESLARSLGAKIGPALWLETPVRNIECQTRPGAPRFRLTLSRNGREESFETDQLVLAVPPDVAGRLLAHVDAEIEPVLGGIEFAAVAVVSLGYEKGAIERDLDGFGFLVPRSVGRFVLGTVWNSSLFPERAPEGRALLTSFVGGAGGPALDAMDDAQLAQLVHRDLSDILSIRKPPLFSSVLCHERALPQYNLGHLERLARLEERRAACPGLWFVGNYLRGPAIGTCVDQALAVAAAVQSAAHPKG